jgi:hypothetical protein
MLLPSRRSWKVVNVSLDPLVWAETIVNEPMRFILQYTYCCCSSAPHRQSLYLSHEKFLEITRVPVYKAVLFERNGVAGQKRVKTGFCVKAENVR